MTDVILCSPITQPVWVPSRVVEASCGHQVWLALTSVEILERGDVKTICTPCGLEDPEVRAAMQKGPRMTTGQRKELNEVVGVGEADQTFARFRFKMLDLDEEEDDGL